jgi:hypothetical protein
MIVQSVGFHELSQYLHANVSIIPPVKPRPVPSATLPIHDDMMIYLLTAIGLTPGGNSTVNVYTQTIHRTIQ